MEDVVLIAGTALMFLFGWFLMKRLDRFLDENQKRIEEAPEQQQPEQCVHLAGNISPDELEETLSRFRSSHAHVEIVIYDSEQISFPDNESDWAQLKPSHLGAIISFKRGGANFQKSIFLCACPRLHPMNASDWRQPPKSWAWVYALPSHHSSASVLHDRLWCDTLLCRGTSY
ncbi:MAG: hypothetical protein WAW97_05585 [Gemmiger qucibialis]